MPGLDGTGPMGQGSMTGRRMGNCVSQNDVDASSPMGFGRGAGRGLRCGNGGRGRGFRNRFFANNTAPQANADNPQIAQLTQQVQILQDQISQLRQQNENSDNQR